MISFLTVIFKEMKKAYLFITEKGVMISFLTKITAFLGGDKNYINYLNELKGNVFNHLY